MNRLTAIIGAVQVDFSEFFDWGIYARIPAMGVEALDRLAVANHRTRPSSTAARATRALRSWTRRVLRDRPRRADSPTSLHTFRVHRSITPTRATTSVAASVDPTE